MRAARGWDGAQWLSTQPRHTTSTYNHTQARGVGRDVYGSNHPNGRIGRRLTLTVASIMLSGDQMPCVPPGTTVGDALVELTRKGTGCLLVVQPDSRSGGTASHLKRNLCGIFTDGDLRRALQNHGGQLMSMAIDAVMTCTPRTCQPDALAVDAMRVWDCWGSNGWCGA